MTPRQIFVDAAQRKNPALPGTGSAVSMVTMDLMDVAGASFPDVHRDAEKMTTLAAAGHTVIGFDNVMPVFSVCQESAALGCEVDWGAKNRMPAITRDLCSDIEQLIEIPSDLLDHPGCKTVLDSIRMLRKRLGDDVSITGKVFGPWTLGYHVYGVEGFLIATITNPDAVKRAMEKMMEVTLLFGRAQIEAGADTLTVADHCTRDLCSPDTYRDFLIATHQQIKQSLDVPLFLHICGDTSDRIPYIAQTGMDCFHYDSKVSAATARKLAGDRLSLMGGSSNYDIVRTGTEKAIVADVAEKIKHQIDIIGPECAVPLDAPYRNLQMMAEQVKQQSGRP